MSGVKAHFAILFLFVTVVRGPATAAIIATVPDVPPLAGYTGNEPEGYRLTPIDVDRDARPDVWFFGNSSGLAIVLALSNRVFTVLSPPPNIGGLVANLGPDVSLALGSNQPPRNGWWTGEVGVRRSFLEDLGLPLDSGVAALGFGDASGNTQSWLRVSGYVGLELRYPEAVYYGWIHIDNDPVVVGYGGYVDAWAFESTPWAPILTGAVPEPSLGLLLAGAAAILMLRPKRGNRHDASHL